MLKLKKQTIILQYFQECITKINQREKKMRKSQKLGNPAFAPTLTAPATYAGEASSDYIAAALLSAKTLDQGNIEIHPNVKYKEVIQKIDVGSIVNDASCNFESTGSVAISEVVLEPKELQVNLELCKQNF